MPLYLRFKGKKEKRIRIGKNYYIISICIMQFLCIFIHLPEVESKYCSLGWDLIIHIHHVVQRRWGIHSLIYGH